MSKYKVIFMGTEDYVGKENGWYGDCIFIYNKSDKKMMVYDCGSEQHAERVVEFMDTNGFAKTDVILSHNDSDHFDGIPYLIESGRVGKIFTTLLLKSEHLDEIIERLDDKRRSREGTKKRILELYDNIAALSGNELKDIYIDDLELPEGIEFVGPAKDIMIDAVVKAIEENDIHTTEGTETLVNSTSLQFVIDVEDDNKLLLLADAAFENIACAFKNHKYIQLPHHGRLRNAEEIFEEIGQKNLLNHEFIVSDNTGNSNGGSDNLMSSSAWQGKVIIKNTKNGDIELKRISHVTFASARENNRGI